MNIAGLCIEVDSSVKLRLYPDGQYKNIDWKNELESELGINYKAYGLKQGYNSENRSASWLLIENSIDDSLMLRLIETKNYILEVDDNCDFSVDSIKFQNSDNKNLKLNYNKDSVRFQFVNYLGRSRITIHNNGNDTFTVPFEVVPDKMDYEEDYIILTEELADKCSNLLIDFSGPTSDVYSQTEDNPETLLEQFIFLRKFCFSQNLFGLFEYIKRNPDKLLVASEEYRPFGTGRPSPKFYTSPFSKGKSWSVYDTPDGSKVCYPQQVAVVHKYDSLDTPANRFILYALRKFDDICERLIKVLDAKGNSRSAECYREAQAIHNMLEEILIDNFWNDIGTLDIMPQNNQVLQKREGYSQIFAAYSMVDLALQLDWKGKDDVYEGESKNVALLYEYWLFFELYEIIKSIDGCEPDKDDIEIKKFIDDSDHLTISLKQGEVSRQCFKIPNLNTKVNLYYNKTFSSKQFKLTEYEGSYSRPFRPDYTIAVFPDKYHKERDAIDAGEVTYIHFDAKYRITDLTSFIGNDNSETGKEPTKEEIEEEFREDKADSITNTYKRGDLLKMHTYNDAIRRTAGSYVLYPGDSSEGREYHIYDEILPGVGAFAIKPSIKTRSESALKDFIKQVIVHNAGSDVRFNRIKYYMNMVLSEPSSKTDSNSGNSSDKNEMIVVGYIKERYYNFLKENGKLNNDGEFLFYFYAIAESNVYSHHKDLFKTKNFVFYRNDIVSEKKYKIDPVMCKILDDDKHHNQLISKKDLVAKLQEQGYQTTEEDHHADFYYVLEVKVIADEFNGYEITTHELNSKYGNDSFSPHSPKILTKGDLNGRT